MLMIAVTSDLSCPMRRSICFPSEHDKGKSIYFIIHIDILVLIFIALYVNKCMVQRLILSTGQAVRYLQVRANTVWMRTWEIWESTLTSIPFRTVYPRAKLSTGFLCLCVCFLYFFPSLLLVFSIEYLETWIVPETRCIWGRVRGSCPGHFQGTGTKPCLIQTMTACIWRLLSQGVGSSCRVIWELQPWLVSKWLGQRNCSQGFWKLNSDPWGM